MRGERLAPALVGPASAVHTRREETVRDVRAGGRHEAGRSGWRPSGRRRGWGGEGSYPTIARPTLTGAASCVWRLLNTIGSLTQVRPENTPRAGDSVRFRDRTVIMV